jgi:hypothetical protein
MSDVFDEIEHIQTQKLASDLPDTIIGTVQSATRTLKKGAYAGAPVLSISITTDDGTAFTTQYRIPKTWTGKGQMDKLLENLEHLKVPLHEIIGKKFEWKRIELEGSVKGNPRFYPVKLIKTPK